MKTNLRTNLSTAPKNSEQIRSSFISEFIDAIKSIFSAIHISYRNNNASQREFRQHQNAIYSEGALQFKLREELTNIVQQMADNPDISAILVDVSPEAYPYITEASGGLVCEITRNIDHSLLISRKDLYV